MISVVILTKNSARTLANTLRSLAKFPEVLIVDTGSSDQTLEIANSYSNVRVLAKKFSTFGPTRNAASLEARYDWILSIDSDEALSLSLEHAIRTASLDPNCVYGLVRENYFRGKKITCSGWNDEKRIRLYHRKKTAFTEDFVHEKIETKGFEMKYFPGSLLHTPFLEERDFIEKLQYYTDLYAKQHHGTPSSYKKAAFRGLWSFFRAYILQKGCLFGSAGWTISFYKGLSSYYKYAKLAELNRSDENIQRASS